MMERKNSTEEFFKEPSPRQTRSDTSHIYVKSPEVSPFSIWVHSDTNLLSLYRLHYSLSRDHEKESLVDRVIQYYIRCRLFHNTICFGTALLYFLINCGIPLPYNMVMTGIASMILFYCLWVITKVILLYVPSIIFGKMRFDGSQPLIITTLLSIGGSEEIQAYHLPHVSGSV
jgi:hypothetical protein